MPLYNCFYLLIQLLTSLKGMQYYSVVQMLGKRLQAKKLGLMFTIIFMHW